MSNPFIIILIIVIIVAIALLIIFTVVSIQQAAAENRKNPIVDQQPCVKSTDELIDISKLPCCCQNEFQTDRRYISTLNVVVAPSPTSYLDACAGFCDNADYNASTETCLTGSSTNFTACINLTKPVNCSDSAMPVAVDGVQPYYVHSATQDECPTSANCAPEVNNCPVESNNS